MISILAVFFIPLGCLAVAGCRALFAWARLADAQVEQTQHHIRATAVLLKKDSPHPQRSSTHLAPGEQLHDY